MCLLRFLHTSALIFHSLPFSACMNICMICTCKINMPADPASSDFHYLAEITRKSDFCSPRPVIQCIWVRTEDECWNWVFPKKSKCQNFFQTKSTLQSRFLSIWPKFIFYFLPQTKNCSKYYVIFQLAGKILTIYAENLRTLTQYRLV